MSRFFIISFSIITLAFLGCKKPYNPPAITAPGSYLVVEGVINSGADSTFIKLSKTVNLSSAVTVNPVQHAVLTVEGDQNVSYLLNEAKNGNYVTAGLNLDTKHLYRLRIKTADGNEYLSDFVKVVNSPPIDTVGFTIQGNGLTIYSGTHDPQNNTRYYRWDYTETWIFHANYFSNFRSNGDTVLTRNLVTDQVYQCWRSDTSSSILLGSSAKLAADVIIDNPITSISSTSEKFTTKYSINLRQYALTGEAFTFWENLKKNTEQLGSIFDAQPSQLVGNIHAINNSKQPVIGYISVGTVSSKRIFISNQQLPAWLPTPAYSDCPLDTALYAYYPPNSKVAINQVDNFINYKKGAINPLIPVGVLAPPGKPIIGYTAASPECVDCTLRGTNKQPSFWK